MAETDNNAQGGNNAPLEMRNTETAALKRIPASSNLASASSAARKTIKLKPLMPSSASASGSQPPPTPAQKSVVPPSILLNKKPAAPQADEPPKFMSTNTAPISKMTAAPAHEKPIPAADLNEAPTKTVSIPRLQAKMASKPAIPGFSATTTAAVPKAAPVTPKPVPTTTAAVPRVTPAPVTPKPVPTTTAAVPRAGQPAIVTPKSPTVILPSASGESTTTQGIQKQAIDQAKMQSGLQGAKPAIKLRPSTSPQAAEPLSPVSPTIKLSPKAESTVSPMPPPPENANPADVTVTTKIPRKTLQLKPKAAMSEAKLKEQGDIANQQLKSGVEEGDQTIKQDGVEQDKKLALKKKAPETPAAPVAPAPVENKPKEKGKYVPREPNIIFSLCAILAFLAVGYTVFALTAQFLNIWQGTQISVPGFSQSSGTVGK